MFTRGKEKPGVIDSVVCIGGKVEHQPWRGEQPTCSLTMVYVNRESGVTFGTCPFATDGMSKETRELLVKFLESAEQDFGKLVFEEGIKVALNQQPRGMAETRKGLGE